MGIRHTCIETTADSYSSHVDTTVNVHGIHDAPIMNSYPHDPVTNFLGGRLEDMPEVWATPSPSAQTDEGSASMFIVHDPRDKIVHYG